MPAGTAADAATWAPPIPSAKSESITKSLDLLKDIDTMTMRYSAQMVASLRNIEANIGGLTSLLVRTGGIDAAVAGVNTGFTTDIIGGRIVADSQRDASFFKGIPVVGDFLSGLIGGLGRGLSKLVGDSTSVVGSGIAIAPQSLGAISTDGIAASYFANVETKHKFLGMTTGTDKSVQYSPADTQIGKQLSLILDGTAQAVQASAQAMGLPLDQISQRLQGFVVDIGAIDLQGLTGDQISEKLTNVFSAEGDKIAQAALSGLASGLDDFQKVGEGFLQTVVRVGSGSEQAQSLLDRLHVSMVSLADVTNKQGDAAAELVRTSLMAREGVSGVADIIAGLSGNASDLATTYGSLVDLRSGLRLLGLDASAVGSSLLNGAGGLQSMTDAVASYQKDFFSDSEQLAIKTSRLREQFSQLGLALPSSRAGFRSLVDGIDTSTDAGQKLLGGLLPLASAFADITDAVQQAGQGIQAEIDRLRGLTSADTAASNYTALQARFALTTAAARAGDATALNNLPGLSKSLSDAVANVATDRLDQARQFAVIANSLEQTQAIGMSASGSAALADAAVNGAVIGSSGAGTSVAASQAITSQNDMLTELRALRVTLEAMQDELTSLRAENSASETAIASNTNRLVRVIERISPDGDAAQVRLVS